MIKRNKKELKKETIK